VSSTGERQRRWRAVAGVVALVALLIGISATPPAVRLERALSRSSLPAPEGNVWNRLQALLGRLGWLALQTPAELATAAGPPSDDGCPPPGLVAGPVRPEAMPSFRLASREQIASGWPLVSLYLEPCRRNRIEARPFMRGRDWEEPG
jgi:hypothetical protein